MADSTPSAGLHEAVALTSPLDGDQAARLVMALTRAAVASRPLDAAREYAAAGLQVFPCRPDKRPATVHGFLDASTDPAVIAAWWERTPDAPIGVPTGSPGPDVLDVDVRADGDGMAALGRCRDAGLLAGAVALVRTAGGGLHVWAVGTDQRCGRLSRHHLDFKATGGYVVVPPSTLGIGRYQLVNARVPRRVCRVDWPSVSALLEPPVRRLPVGPGGAGVGALAAWVASQSEGNRNAGLFWACCRAVESGESDLDCLVDAAVSAGLDRNAAIATARSAWSTAGAA